MLRYVTIYSLIDSLLCRLQDDVNIFEYVHMQMALPVANEVIKNGVLVFVFVFFFGLVFFLFCFVFFFFFRLFTFSTIIFVFARKIESFIQKIHFLATT